MTIGNRIKRTREELGYSRSEFARVIGVTYMSIKGWEEDLNVPTNERLTRLANALKKSEQWILYGSDNAITEYEPADGYVAIPVFDVKASCGSGAINYCGDEVARFIELDEKWLRWNANFTNINNLSIVTAQGDSMKPTIESGDILLVDRGVIEVRYDSIYIFMCNRQLYVKRIQLQPNGRMKMISDNKTYESYEFQENDELTILGRIVLHWTPERL